MVRYSQCRKMAANKAAVDTKKPNHQIPVFFFCVSMIIVKIKKVKINTRQK
jgi:hypothetical protein